MRVDLWGRTFIQESARFLSLLGWCLAAVYLVAAIGVYAATSDHEKSGVDWFPMHLFAQPWRAIDQRFLWHGFLTNMALVYLLGAVLPRVSRIARKLEDNLRAYFSTWGFWLAGVYSFVVVAVFARTAAVAIPSNMGVEWLPLMLLAGPWHEISWRLVYPGFVLNALLLYALGALLEDASHIVEDLGW